MVQLKIRHLAGFLPCCLLLAAATVRADKPVRVDKPARTAAAPDAAQLAYQLKLGDSHRYKLTAFFTGRFPPFASAGSPPINLEADLVYVTTVKKVDDKGALVDFAVDEGEVYLLEKEPAPGEVIKDDDKTEFPVPLSQIQQTLNATAYIREDGSIVSIEGGNNSNIKVDIGFDLRKIFLTIMPVIFPAKTLKLNDVWSFDDGVLGHKPSSITYSATIQKVDPSADRLSYQIGETAQSIVSTQVDKQGNSTDKPADVAGTLVGKVTADGTLTFVTPHTGTKGGQPDIQKGRLVKGNMTMVVLLKRTLPDPANPDTKATTDIDVKGRLTVVEDTTKPKLPTSTPAASPAASDAH